MHSQAPQYNTYKIYGRARRFLADLICIFAPEVSSSALVIQFQPWPCHGPLSMQLNRSSAVG